MSSVESKEKDNYNKKITNTVSWLIYTVAVDKTEVIWKQVG